MIFYVSNGGRGTDASVKFKDMNEIRKSISKAYPGALFATSLRKAEVVVIPDGAVHPASVPKNTKVVHLTSFLSSGPPPKATKAVDDKKRERFWDALDKTKSSVPVITKTDMHKKTTSVPKKPETTTKKSADDLSVRFWESFKKTPTTSSAPKSPPPPKKETSSSSFWDAVTTSIEKAATSSSDATNNDCQTTQDSCQNLVNLLKNKHPAGKFATIDMIEATIRDAVGSMSHSMVHDLAVTIQKGLQKEDQKSVAAAAASFPPKRKIVPTPISSAEKKDMEKPQAQPKQKIVPITIVPTKRKEDDKDQDEEENLEIYDEEERSEDEEDDDETGGKFIASSDDEEEKEEEEEEEEEEEYAPTSGTFLKMQKKNEDEIDRVYNESFEKFNESNSVDDLDYDDNLEELLQFLEDDVERIMREAKVPPSAEYLESLANDIWEQRGSSSKMEEERNALLLFHRWRDARNFATREKYEIRERIQLKKKISNEAASIIAETPSSTSVKELFAAIAAALAEYKLEYTFKDMGFDADIPIQIEKKFGWKRETVQKEIAEMWKTLKDSLKDLPKPTFKT